MDGVNPASVYITVTVFGAEGACGIGGGTAGAEGAATGAGEGAAAGKGLAVFEGGVYAGAGGGNGTPFPAGAAAYWTGPCAEFIPHAIRNAIAAAPATPAIVLFIPIVFVVLPKALPYIGSKTSIPHLILPAL